MLIVSFAPHSQSEEAKYLSIRPYLQRYALNTTLTLCYGIRMDSVWDGMLREVLEVGSAISLLRSASENYQDYIPSKPILALHQDVHMVTDFTSPPLPP